MDSAHHFLVTNTNATSFQRYCCINEEIYEHIQGEVQSVSQMLNATKMCFSDLNITSKMQLKLLVKLSSGSYNYRAEDCHIVADPCNSTTTLSYIGYICLWIALWLMIVSSNILVIMAVQKVSYLRDNIGNYLIASLALSDLCVGLFLIPIKIKFAYNNLYFCSISLCRFYITADTALFSTSITNIFVISIDRYLALTYPYKYQTWMTLTRCKFIIAGIWMFGCTWGLLSNFNWSDFSQPAIHIRNYQCLQNNSIYTFTVYSVVFYIPAVVMAVIYFRILSIARYHAQVISGSVLFRNDNKVGVGAKLPEEGTPDILITTGEIKDVSQSTVISNENAENLNESEIRRSSKTMQLIRYRKIIFKASKTVATVYCTFFICWFPVSALSFALSYCRKCFDGPKLKWFYLIFVEVLPIFNSTMNPFIYAIMNKQYRQSYKIILSKLKMSGVMNYFRPSEKTATSSAG